MPAIDVEDLWEAYRRRARTGRVRRGPLHWVLRGVNLSIDSGEALGIVGINGSGKTTLLRAMGGVFPPAKGRVSVTGRASALIDLTLGVHRDLTGYENVLVAGVLTGMSRRQVRERFEAIAAFAGLDDAVMSSPVFTYSLGMLLRLNAGLLVHSDPAVLLIDEVLASADEKFTHAFLDRVDALRNEGCAVVMVSHDLDLIAKRCTRAAVLSDGVIWREGRPLDVINAYRERGSDQGTS